MDNSCARPENQLMSNIRSIELGRNLLRDTPPHIPHWRLIVTRVTVMPDVLTLPNNSGGSLVAAEFFAGIGLVRIGLERAGFRVAWSNDIEPTKQAMYDNNFRNALDHHRYALGDIANVRAAELPSDLALAWASFPCIDLSLAGRREGLGGEHSATFWHFTRILDDLGTRRPPVVALENVAGLATSRGGADLAAAIGELNRLGYSVDLLAIDARRFVPQSRPRLFVIGAQDPPQHAQQRHPFRPKSLRAAFDNSSLRTHQAALPPVPAPMTKGLRGVIEQIGADDARWWDDERVAAFAGSLSPLQHERLDMLRRKQSTAYRTAYRRTRHGVAVWEVRSDDIAGCLRTARGGSSRQALVEVGRGQVRARWMTPVEYARLMGADGYKLDGLRTNQALFGFGDAVCVPVVEWLAANYLVPLVDDALRPVERRADQLAVNG